jgi:IclR family transcriptional regulator, pca regulon regulatory protein
MMRARNQIHSLAKGLEVIRMFSSKSSISLSEMASTQHMSIGSAHRYLNTLHSLGYIKQNPETKRYQLTPKILQLGFSALKDMNLRKRVLPYLLETSREFNITTACSVLDDTEILYIERVRSTELVNLDLSAGSRLPLHCTSMGKALLSFLPEEEREATIEKLELRPLTPYTITNKETLKKELEQIKARGYATCRQELNLGLESIAAPLFNDGKVEAAISFNLPKITGNPKSALEKALIRRLLIISKEISI